MLLPWTEPSQVFNKSKHKVPATRLADCIFPDDGRSAEIGILGLASDLAVVQGGGRAGANLGPSAIREALLRTGSVYNLDYGVDLSSLRILDCGDLIPDPYSVSETHCRISEAVSAMLARGLFPICLGGGHDLTFPAIRALATCFGGSMGGIAFDAHCDLRPVVDGVITSGTPFRNILEHIDPVSGQRFVEIGLNALVNVKAHLDYLASQGGRFYSRAHCHRIGMATVLKEALATVSQDAADVFCSIDMDVMAQAFAPGVSAPSSEGLSPEDMCLAAYESGRHPQVSYFDIMELNPRFDVDGRTAKLAASLICYFATGFVQRKKSLS